MDGAERIVRAIEAILAARRTLESFPEDELERRIAQLVRPAESASEPASHPAPAPAPATPPADEREQIAAAVLAAADALEEGRLVLDPALVDFASRVRDVFSSLQPGELDSEKGRQVLVACLRRLDALTGAHRHGARAERAHAIVAPAIRLIEEALRAHGGFATVPVGTGDGTVAALRTAWVELSGPGAAEPEVRQRPSDRPAGAILRVVRRSLASPGASPEPPVVDASAGRDPPATSLMRKAYREIEALAQAASRPAARQAIGEALARLADLIDDGLQDEGDPAREATAARYGLEALDAVLTASEEPAIERAHARASAALLRFLEERGIFSIPLPVEEEFGEAYPPKLFERKLVPSSEPKDRVLRVLRRGLQTREGICIQKALIAVSRGSSGPT